MEIDNKYFLLFMEPESSNQPPIIDTYTKRITGALRASKHGLSGYSAENSTFHVCDWGYKGIHICSCGAVSSNHDYLLETKEDITVKLIPTKDSFFSQVIDEATEIKGIITNSLCIHYVACHRNEIDPKELERILFLKGEEAEPTQEELNQKNY